MTERSYNYSSIQAAYKCLKYYKLLYVDRIKPDVPHSADMSFGTSIHAAVQAILEGDNGLDVFTAYWDSEKDKGLKYGRYDWAALREQGEVLLTRFQRLHAHKFKIFKMEERIFTTIDGVRLEGTPDFVGEFEGVPSIVDFKCMGYNIPLERLISNEQMPLYSIMAEKEWGYKAEQLVYFPFIKGTPPKIQTPVIVKMRDVDVPRTLANVLSVCRELDQRQEFHENRANCMMGAIRCDAWEICFGRKK